MKITMNVDCTPEEARAFLGLPDVQPLQATVMDELGERLRAGLAATDPESLMKTWFPVGVQNAEQIGKLFWGQLQVATRDDRTTEEGRGG